MDSLLEEDLVTIGKNIHKIRKQKKMNLKDLAKLVSISAPYLSQIENGKVNFSLNDLVLIGNALNVSISSFFIDAEKSKTRLVRKKDIIWKPLFGSTTEAVLMKSLSDFEVSIIQIPEGQNSGFKNCHDGSEFCFVTDGALEIELENNGTHILRTGDACYFDASIPHRWVNNKSEKAEIIIINTVV
jgi:transcriptional regulator with XRE-family HTH domain